MWTKKWKKGKGAEGESKRKRERRIHKMDGKKCPKKNGQPGGGQVKREHTRADGTIKKNKNNLQ